ncbi:MAG: hypothetical protein ACP5EQ_03070 [Candidatus Cloacimonadia bacterium]
MKRVYLIAFLAVVLLLSSCTIKDFEAPEFDKKISLALMDERYYASDIADTTDDYIIAVSNDSMQFSITEDIETQKIGDELKIEAEPQFYEEKLDTIRVEETGESKAGIKMLDAMGVTDEINSQPIPPLYNLPWVEADFSVFENDNIEYVIIDSGYGFVTIFNKTDLPIGSSDSDPTHQTKIEIYGQSITTDNLILDLLIDSPISPRESRSFEIDLAGKKIYRENFLNAKITSDGTEGEPIDILHQDSVIVEFGTGEITIIEGKAKLSEQYERSTEAISIIDQASEVQLQSAVIDSCVCAIHLENRLPIAGNISISFKELLDTSDEPYQFEIDIPAASITDTLLDFSGFEIRSGTDNILDSLHFQYAINTESTDNFVEIYATDYVSLNISLGEVRFEEITGIIRDKKIELEEIEKELDIEDLPENIEHMLDFQNVELVITINNDIDIGGRLYGRLKGYNDDTGENAEVNIENESIQPSDITEIIIDEGVSELINIIPQRIVGDSLYVIIDGGDIVSITSEDSISSSFTLRTPFEFIINDKEGIRPDSVEHVEMDEDTRETIGDHLNEVTLNLIAENSFPFGLQIDVFFATEEDSVYDSPDYCVDSLIVTRPEPEQEASMNELVIELGRDAIEVFTNPDVYIGVELAVQGSDGETVILRASDNIRLHGYLTVEGHISESLWED